MARAERGSLLLEAVLAMALLAMLGIVLDSLTIVGTPHATQRRAELTTMATNVLSDLRAATMYDGSIADALAVNGSATRVVPIPGAGAESATCVSTFTSSAPGVTNVSISCTDANGVIGSSDGTLMSAAPTPGAVIQ